MSDRVIRNRVAVIIVEDEKILLVQHEKHGRRYWLLPGGGVEYAETIAEAGRRELLEETGYEVTIGDLLFISESIPPDEHRHVINYYFVGKRTGGELQVEDSKILRDVQWHHIDDLPHLTMYPNTGREIREWIRSGRIEKRSFGNRWD